MTVPRLMPWPLVVVSRRAAIGTPGVPLHKSPPEPSEHAQPSWKGGKDGEQDAVERGGRGLQSRACVESRAPRAADAPSPPFFVYDGHAPVFQTHLSLSGWSFFIYHRLYCMILLIALIHRSWTAACTEPGELPIYPGTTWQFETPILAGIHRT